MKPDYAAPGGAFGWFGFGFYRDAAPTALGFSMESDVWGRILFLSASWGPLKIGH
jgi:hypothetical protein